MLKEYLSYSPIDLNLLLFYVGDRETLPDHSSEGQAGVWALT